MEYWRPRLIGGGTPFGVESHIIAMEAGRASCVDKLPGPGERGRVRTLGEGDSLVTVEHVIELPRGGGRGTRWARQRRATMDVARLVRSRHGVQVVLRRGLTDVGDVGADGLGQEAITKRWGVGPERCEQSEHVRRQHSTKDDYKEDNRPQLTDRLVTVTGSYVGLRRECIQRTIRQCTALAAIDGERDPLVIYHR